LNGLAFFRLGLWYDSIQALTAVEKNSKQYGLAQLVLSKALRKSDRTKEADQAWKEFLNTQDKVLDLSPLEHADLRQTKSELAETN
jgi:hypothetical protein